MLAAVLAVLACLRLASAAPAPASSAGAPSPASSTPTQTVPSATASVAPLPAASAPSAAPSGVSSAAPQSAASAAPAGRPAADAADDGPRQWLHGEDINWTRQIMTTIVWLALMCGGIWLILRLLYGRLGLAGLSSGTRRNIQVLDRHILGPQKALIMVSVPGKVLLLGMTEQNITTLTELAPEDVEMAGLGAPPLQGPLAVRAVEKAGYEGPPDNLVDLAGLFGRRGAQTNKGENQE